MYKVCNKCKSLVYYDDGKIMTTCKCGNPIDPWECDEDIYPLLRVMWQKGYETMFSCAGHCVSRYNTDAGIWVLTNKIDVNGYIAFKASNVKCADIMKYKYGTAYIDYLDPKECYKEQMIENGIDLPEGYQVSADDETFIKYVNDFYKEEDAKTIIEHVKHCEPSYNIRSEYMHSEHSLDMYKHLMESRSDIATLVYQLPDNN